MCALRPEVRGISDRIRVRSIVGRLLEHSRIFYFANGGEEELYVGSADWMPRNLYERVEVIFPVSDGLLKQRIRQEILEAYLADTAKARVLQPDGGYTRANTLLNQRRKAGPLVSFNAQEFLIALAEGKRTLDAIPRRIERRRRLRLREEVGSS